VIESIAREDFSDVDLAKRQRDLKTFAHIPAALEDLKPDVLPLEEAFATHDIDFRKYVLDENEPRRV
jgi:hypothetical protein